MPSVPRSYRLDKASRSACLCALAHLPPDVEASLGNGFKSPPNLRANSRTGISSITSRGSSARGNLCRTMRSGYLRTARRNTPKRFPSRTANRASSRRAVAPLTESERWGQRFVSRKPDCAGRWRCTAVGTRGPGSILTTLVAVSTGSPSPPQPANGAAIRMPAAGHQCARRHTALPRRPTDRGSPTKKTVAVASLVRAQLKYPSRLP